ncbi:uncharacterized protein LOC129762873 [Toxorhynchites rutilus septentrionalis]|uniref:uncharacterized protein LOC129762873 n=1 Tax=Toxorhynchites rutilus septentrionalis TaxID=329112 RepID=UPI00247AF328|nr:uncharacterized protein LOC129762873 [Toxorhynchites rutilus septentrionalis]
MFIFIFIICSMLIIQAEIQIHDLNRNPIAIIPLGKVKIKIGHIRIIQPIDLNQLHDIILKFDNLIKQNVFNSQLYRLLENRNHLLYQTYLKIVPHNTSQSRMKRWDDAGRILKWIAGTPDADDLKIINNTMNSLIDYNNQQMFVNEALNSRVNHLSQITNELLELDFKSKQQHIIEINLLTILLNLDKAQHQLVILEDAILLAKNGIPSSQILSMKDYLKISKFLQKQNITVTSFEELLTKINTQIAINNTHVIYMMKIPQLSNEVYDYEYINPLIHNETRIHVESNYVINNKSHIFEVSRKCEKDAEYFLCEPESLKIANLCIKNLIQLRHANCTHEKVYSTGIIKRINDATILLNNVNITIQSNCSHLNQLLEGSYLINFAQCEIYLGHNQYTNMIMESPKKLFRPTTGILAYEDDIIDIPTPEYLANLTLKHRSMINHVYLQNNSLERKLHLYGTISFSTFFLIAIIITIYFIYIRKQSLNTNIEISLHEQEKASAPEENQLNKSLYPDISEERMQQINIFLRMPTADRPI